MSIQPSHASPAAEVTVFEASERDFETAVLQKSHEVPVLLDFWAPWCQPCQVLGPTLEKLAAESGGRFILAKVNLDENPNLAAALRIQSIPAVKLVVDGQLRGEFMGAYPEAQVQAFLDQHLPSAEELEAKQGIGALREGHAAEAEAVFRETLASDPDNARALVGLGLILVERGELEEARTLMRRAKEEADIRRELAQLRAKVFLTECAGNPAATQSEPAPAEPATAEPHTTPEDAESIEARFAAAAAAALQGQHTKALDGFLEIVRTDRAFRDDGGRKGMVAMFDILPVDSSLTNTYRGKLSSILFR